MCNKNLLKICKICKEEKSIDEFDKHNPKKNNYLRYDCRVCRKKRNREAYLRKKEAKAQA